MQRPESDVSAATGLVGAVFLAGLIAIAAATDMSLGAATLLLLVGTAAPMVVWDLAVNKVHRRPSTGLDLSTRLPAAEVWSLTRVKLVGLGATLSLLGLGYFAIRTYAAAQYQFYVTVFCLMAPVLLAAGVFYVPFVTRHMAEPKDGLWHFGKLVCLDLDAVDMEKVKEHLRQWAIKGFFLALMISILPAFVGRILQFDPALAVARPVEAILCLVQLMFVFDVCFAAIGYTLTLRPLDSHIRSANPYLAGWTAALVCYPPFLLMGHGGPLDYRSGTQEWFHWFDGNDAVLLIWGLAIVVLMAIYAWATVTFGLRFSNLTHRGIITNGPYRWFKHPAYLAKNLAWWLIHMPFLSTVGPGDALRNCLLLLAVNLIYYARARTEEKHLMADPQYRAYSAWIARHGVAARLLSVMRGWLAGGRSMAPGGEAGDGLSQPVEGRLVARGTAVE